MRHARRMRIVPCVGSSWDVGQTQKQTALRLFGWTRATLRHISDGRAADDESVGKHLEATMDFERALLLEPTSKILAKERDESKSAFELEANVRPTQARRVVPIEVRGVNACRRGDKAYAGKR